MRRKQKRRRSWIILRIFAIVAVCTTVVFTALLSIFSAVYKGKIYPSVFIENIPFGGETKETTVNYWLSKSSAFTGTSITFVSPEKEATLSALVLDLSYNATLSADQAFSIGRSPNVFTNIFYRFISPKVNLPISYSWNDETVKNTIASYSALINIEPKNALFTFKNGKVTAFQPSKSGKRVDEKTLRDSFKKALPSLAQGDKKNITIDIPVEILNPTVKTDEINPFGIKERIGLGYSEFSGSIPGRIHNVTLAASRINGVLIKPGEVFSFNKAVGDISAATGYQSAYIIKDGRTVMGDGGGVCQVSTTLFRAAMNAGLPIIERHAHSYRVHYYEEGGFKAGIDATVFDPTEDLKFKNDTPGYILIQTSVDSVNLIATFELYGASDGRKAELLNHNVWGIEPPPPDLYQDDPTLPMGTVKQVDFAAWGAKASFDYKVTRNGEVINKQTFTSNFRPWQAVYLKGTKQ